MGRDLVLLRDVRVLACTLLLLSGCACDAPPGTADADALDASVAPDAGATDDAGAVDAPRPPGDDAPGGSREERLLVGTGEYSAMQDWHAILRFEHAESIDVTGGAGGPTPDATIPVKESGDAAGVHLNFAHGLYLDEARDELWVAAIFTNATNSESMLNPMSDAGSVGVIASASTVDGPQRLSRHLFGAATRLRQPHGVWLDRDRDIAYVANTFGDSILIWDEAHLADGNLAPTREITSPRLGHPVFVFVEPTLDLLFVAVMRSDPRMSEPSIAVYANASTLDGEVEPNLVIAGPMSRIAEGSNQTTHNVWYDAARDRLFVGHHTNEVLIFDTSGVDLTPAAPMRRDLPARVLRINEVEDDSDARQWSVYGLFYLSDADRLYVSCGFANPPMGMMMSGGPRPGSPPNVVRVYEGASGLTGRPPADRTIAWQSGELYFPPQPLWVTVVSR